MPPWGAGHSKSSRHVGMELAYMHNKPHGNIGRSVHVRNAAPKIMRPAGASMNLQRAAYTMQRVQCALVDKLPGTGSSDAPTIRHQN